jgi:hypothetical protein
MLSCKCPSSLRIAIMTNTRVAHVNQDSIWITTNKKDKLNTLHFLFSNKYKQVQVQAAAVTMSSNDSDKPKEDETAKSSSSSSFTMPDMKDASSMFRQGIHQGCKWTVDTTNAALGKLQVATKSAQKPVTTVVEECEKYGTMAATQCRIVYERRHEFAPYYVAGATLGVGGLSALRRGRVTGVMLGALAGGITYMALYEPLLDQAPTIDWPFKNLTRNLGGADKKE